ncbi:MAG: hypothetical protein M0R03_20240 [Novosphingobium sp.]|nr:hypothetical protein [Novosphingobium sp.]
MYVKEIKLEPVKYQEVFLTSEEFILNAILKSTGEAVLLIESISVPNTIESVVFDEEKESCGVFLLKSGDYLPPDVADQYRYISTLNMHSEIGSVIFHVYVEAMDYVELEDIMEDERGF